MASIKEHHLNTEYKAETVSSSFPLCCDGAPRKGRELCLPMGQLRATLSQKKASSWSTGNKSITAVCFHLQDKSLEKTFTLGMIFFFKTDNKQKASHSKA